MHSVATAAVQLLVLRVLGALVGFVASVVVSRVLGAEDAGSVFWAIGVCALAAGVSRLGIDTVLTRDIALAESSGNKLRVAELAKTAYLLVLAISATITVVLLIVFQFHAGNLSRHLTYPAFFAVPGLAVIGLAAAVLIGRSKAMQSIFLQSVFMPLLFVAGVLTLGKSFGTTGVAISYSAASWLAVCLGIVLSLRYTKASNWRVNMDVCKTLVAGSPALFSIGLAKIWMEWGGTITLGGMRFDTEAAYFSAATRITGALAFLVAAVEAHLAPRFAVALRSEHGVALGNRLFKEARATTLGIGIPVVMVLVLFAPDILAIFGADFSAGAAVLRILCIGQLVNAFTGPSTIFVLMNAEYPLVMRIVVQAVVLSIVLSLVLTPVLGATGTATAFTASLAWIHIRAYWRVMAILRRVQ